MRAPTWRTMRAQRSGFATLNASEHQSLRRICNEALYFIDAPGFPAMTSGCNTQAPTSERCQQTSSLSPKGLLVKWVMVGSEVAGERLRSGASGSRWQVSIFLFVISCFLYSTFLYSRERYLGSTRILGFYTPSLLISLQNVTIRRPGTSTPCWVQRGCGCR